MLMAGLLCACEENDHMTYDPETSMLNLWFGQKNSLPVDSTVYNYAYRGLGTELDSVMFHVRLAGLPATEDRVFHLEAVKGDLEKIVEDKHYAFGSYILKAGEIEGDFPIYLKNTEAFKDTVYAIVLALKEEAGLARGAKEYSEMRLIVKDRAEKPENWDNDGWPYFPLKNFFGTYSRTKHQFIISVTQKTVFRVLYQGTPTPPNEISYFEAQYLQKKCRLALAEYNNNPENPDRPLSDENGPITF